MRGSLGRLLHCDDAYSNRLKAEIVGCMSITEEQRRFNWIHLYCDALRWTVVNEVTYGEYWRVEKFQDLADGLCQWWLNALQDNELKQYINSKRGRGCYWSPLLQFDFWYLYDLEAELWGANFDQFVGRDVPDGNIALEPFRFVLLFYLIERGLKLVLAHLGFLDYEQSNLSHARIRDAGYSHLFEQESLSRWFPCPFNLSALTNRIDCGASDFARHQAYSFIGSHFSVVGKKHYTEILEGALRRATVWQRKRHTSQGQRPRVGSIRAYFFDPMWRYSETYRYRVPLASEYARQNPFYWGLDLRWVGSAFICVLELWLYTFNARVVREVWDTYSQQSKSPVLQAIQLPRWQAIRDTHCQTLI